MEIIPKQKQMYCYAGIFVHFVQMLTLKSKHIRVKDGKKSFYCDQICLLMIQDFHTNNLCCLNQQQKVK